MEDTRPRNPAIVAAGTRLVSRTRCGTQWCTADAGPTHDPGSAANRI